MDERIEFTQDTLDALKYWLTVAIPLELVSSEGNTRTWRYVANGNGDQE